MTPKSERFEMRLDEDLLERVDHWRVQENDAPSRAEAMRRLIEVGLDRSSGESVHFSDGEKLLLIMFRDLYKHFDVKGDIDPNFVGEVLWGGHFWAPKWKMPGLFHGHEDDPRELKFVVDVLDMWDSLERGYERLPNEAQNEVRREADVIGDTLEFMGFDGNTEASYGNIAQFLIEEMGRFTRFAGRELNAHLPTLETHRQMLAEFKSIRRKLLMRDLNADELIAILKAGERQ